MNSYTLPVSPYNSALRSRTEYISEKHLVIETSSTCKLEIE